MRLYPICLKLDNRICCVIGGGMVALRKVKTLLKSSDNIIVISPKLCPQLKKLYEKNAFKYEKSEYKQKFIKDAFLIIAATNDNKVNKQIVSDAAKMNKLINVVDVPEQCNFYLPAVVNKKGVLLSVSTQGAFPGLARKIRQEAEEMIKGYSGNISVLSRLRDEIKNNYKNSKVKKQLIRALLDKQVLGLINKKKIIRLEQLKAHLKIL